MNLCLHCDEAGVPPIYQEQDVRKSQPFCCEGSLTVYNVLHTKGIEAYYDVKNNSQIIKRRSPLELKQSKFQFMNEPDFIREYSYTDDQNSRYMEFYLEGIHCLAWFWLIEKIPEFVPNVFFTKLDLEGSVVTVILNCCPGTESIRIQTSSAQKKSGCR